MTGWGMDRLIVLALLAAAGVMGTGGGARAQTVVVLEMEGWRRSVAPNGVVAYACASRLCPAGSQVSYKAQPHRPTVGRAQFEGHHTRIARDAPGASGGRITAAAVEGFAERTVEGVRVLSIRRSVSWSDGARTVAVDALLIGPKASFSVVSDAAEPAAAEAGFDHFLPRLIDIVLVAQ